MFGSIIHLASLAILFSLSLARIKDMQEVTAADMDLRQDRLTSCLNIGKAKSTDICVEGVCVREI